jgi:hypothetical protein
LTPEVWIALFGLIGTLGAGLGATALNNRAARDREELQWNREVGEKRRLERLDAFEEFTSLTLLNSHRSKQRFGRRTLDEEPTSLGAARFSRHGGSRKAALLCLPRCGKGSRKTRRDEG